MKSSKILLGIALSAAWLSGCNNDVDCAEERGENFAIEILNGDLPDCPFEGTVTDESTGEESAMVCSYSDGQCACRGGNDFALYRINITDTRTNEASTALIEVKSAGSPICVSRKTVEGFTPVDGAGGAGGAAAPD